MKNQNWEKIKDVFAQVLEQPVNNRIDYLQEICRTDRLLQAEVISLLKAHDETQQLIEIKDYAASSVLSANNSNYQGKRFGNYKILREIGRGGMGTVFLAERTDGEFDQQVALKIVRQSFADAELERRFRRERQILALLNHPNIAKLLDGGISDGGEPFLAMEYVEGEPLLSFSEKQNYDIESRLQLFLKVCAAVSYAHRNLIVHRDIKPSNILVDKTGEPKLLDFGLAKIFNEDVLEITQTETAFRAFTPAYASPEQMHGKNISTTSDVYSLGVVFYELLTGERPFHFEHKSYEEILRSIDTLEPPLPSSILNSASFTGKIVQTQENLDLTQNGSESKPTKNSENKISQLKKSNIKALRGDLDNIALMALRKEPELRYQSVEQFARDIERHLQGLPITARPQTLSYRASKFIQRNRIAVTALGFVILSLTIGLAVALWQADAARQQKFIAEKRFNDVRRLSNSLLFEISPKIERLQGSTEAREILVERALEYLDSLAKEADADLALQSELASAYEKIGNLQGAPGKPNLSDFSGALLSLEKAQAIRLKLSLSQTENTDNQMQLAASFAASSYIRWWMSDITNSIKDSQKALEIYDKLLAENSNLTKLRVAGADARINLAQTYYFNDQVAEVYLPLRTALDELETLSAIMAADIEVNRLFSKARVLLGLNLFWDGKSAEGEIEINKAVKIAEALAAKNPNDNVVNQGLWHVYIQSLQFYQESNPNKSFEYLTKALKVVEKSVKNDPFDTQAQQNLAKTYSQLGSISLRREKLDDAVFYLEKSLLILTELEKAEPKNITYKADIGRNYGYLGLTKHKQQKFSDGLTAFAKAVAVFKLQSTDSKNVYPRRQLANIHNYIADIHNDLEKRAAGEEHQKHRQSARENYQLALDILTQLKSENSLAEIDHKFLERMHAALQKYKNK